MGNREFRQLPFRVRYAIICAISKENDDMEFLSRKTYDKLKEWKCRSNGRTAVMIDGARRVGKTCLVEEFVKREYRTAIVVDFSKVGEQIKETIKNRPGDLDALFNTLSLTYGVRLYPRESAIVFDEVQLFPLARQLIKHLVADGRYDYIETGSLISLKRNIRDILIPSEEEHIEMPPMDFEEFRWALGDDVSVPFAKECLEAKKPLGHGLHRQMMDRYYEYLLVGGMPQAVGAYIATKDFGAADDAKRGILRIYRDDIAKFAQGYEAKVRAIFDTIPEQLSRKEKRYKLSSITKAARFREYEDAFTWLNDARVVNPCFNATEPSAGLGLSREHTTQKLYMADTGLLVTHAYSDGRYTDNGLYRDIFFGNVGANNGMIIENAVAQEFRATGRNLYFYSRVDRDRRMNEMEIDFLIRRNGEICPVEVKSAAYQHHASLDKFIAKFKDRLGQPCILYTKDIMEKDGILHLPLYMAMFL